MNDREKRLIVVNYAPNKPLIMRKRIGGLKDRLKARSRFFRSRKEGLWPFLRPWGKSKEAVLLQSSLLPDLFNDLDWVIARIIGQHGYWNGKGLISFTKLWGLENQ